MASLAAADDGSMTLLLKDKVKQSLRVVSWYKHMGGILWPDCRMKPEISARNAAMFEALSSLRPQFKRNGLSLKAKSGLADSLCFSRLFYNVGIWHCLSVSNLKSLNAAYVSALCAVASMQNTKKSPTMHTDKQVLEATNQPCVRDVLHVHVLRYFLRLMESDCLIVKRLVALVCPLKLSWVSRLKEALSAVWVANKGLRDSMPDPCQQLGDWFDVLRTQPATWRPLLCKAKFGKPHVVAIDVDDHDIKDQHVCHCGRAFDSLKALRSHETRKHGYFNRFRRKIASTVCMACMREFHFPMKMFRHVVYSSPSCHEFYKDVDDVDAQQSDLFWSQAPKGSSKLLPRHPEHVGVYFAGVDD